MNAQVLLLGSTDFTLAIAEAVKASGASVGAIVHVEDQFRISYAAGGVKNFRSADIAGWCAAHAAQAIVFDSFASLPDRLPDACFDACIVAGWYHMVPKAFRAGFPQGCIGFHASLLPKLRGGAPLNWAILSGLHETGVSMFEIGDGVDDGPLYDQARLPIGPDTRIGELVEASKAVSVAMVARMLPGVLSGAVKPVSQAGEPSYCLQRMPEDGRIGWRRPAIEIARLVRAVSRPYPGALARLDEREFAIHAASVFSEHVILGMPGQIANIPGVDAPLIVCGEASLRVTEAIFEDGTDALPVLRQSSNRRLATR